MVGNGTVAPCSPEAHCRQRPVRRLLLASRGEARHPGRALIVASPGARCSKTPGSDSGRDRAASRRKAPRFPWQAADVAEGIALCGRPRPAGELAENDAFRFVAPCGAQPIDQSAHIGRREKHPVLGPPVLWRGQIERDADQHFGIVPPRAGVQPIFASGIEEFHEVSSPSFSVTAVDKGVRPLCRQRAMAARSITRRSGHASRHCRLFRSPLLVHFCANCSADGSIQSCMCPAR
jgi:hypothetical protein